ncbi:hypothetical protein MICAF_2300003 [Microcystis aeruginosa PCC 9807]|uniref:Uncharacterized protein n=1 Tax=Microcystis aeruginosa PCC 9807 TaxID=1160283 RepID=I4H4A5_MICAE|nr:hypothetical protein MICAF_2300003 [Microcystis aeruginosa PCC 9807]
MIKKLAILSVNLSFINVQWLTDNEIEGKVIELKTRYHDQDYFISDRVGNDRSITNYDQWKTLWGRSKGKSI